MAWFRKAFYIVLSVLLLLLGLWLVIVNNQQISLNLFFTATPQLNAGFVVLVSFAVGALVGILVGLNLITVFRLNSRIFWLKREVRQLQDDLTERRSRL